MSELRALLFDVDGTLAESEDLHRVTFNETFADFGLDWHWDRDLYRDLLRVTGGKERIRHFAEDHLGDRMDWDRIAALHAEKSVRYRQGVADGRLPLRPGIETMVRTAHDAGIALAVATTTSLPNVTALLEATLGAESLAWFAAMATSEDAADKKPDPTVYRVALDRLGVPAADCLAVEDSANGLRAALGAGVPTVITRSPWSVGDDYAGALAVFETLAETSLDALRALHAEAEAA